MDGVRACVSQCGPQCRSVSVIGDFNYWDGRRHQMRVLGSSGVWVIFIPELGPGAKYKYEIKTRLGHVYQKADPTRWPRSSDRAPRR